MSDSVTLKREELYAQVWADPMIRLAARYGITGTGLAKICRKLNIPVPSRGYGQRKQVGRPDPQPPLPPGAQGTPATVIITPTPTVRSQLAPEVTACLAAEDKAENRISLADRLVNPHPLVQLTRIALEHGQADEYGALHGRRGQQCLDLRLSKQSLHRALRILDALFKALGMRGASVHLGTDRWERTYVKIANEKVQIRLEEEFRRIAHVPTKTELAAQQRSPWNRPARWDYEATGRLQFQILEYTKGTRKSWADGRTQRLDEMLNDIVKGIFITAEVLRANREAWERKERERQAELMRQAELEQQRREEEARRQELERQVNRWVVSRNLRTFLGALEEEAARQGCSAVPDSQLGVWLAWARQHADRLDPIPVVLRLGQSQEG